VVLRRLDLAGNDWRPVYVVWELTLACDQPCTHCGSRAGEARARELTRDEALGVVKQLAAMRAEEVALIGGEAYLHPAFLDVLAAIRDAGMRPTMVTGGRGVTAELARAVAERGLYSVSVSVDGLRETHDLMRAARGSFDSANAALGHFAAAGVTITANTNVNRLNAPELEALYDHLRGRGVAAWQVQLTAPLGRAADRADLILQPWDLLDVVPRVAALKRRAFADGILVMPGNNLGYFGPEEALLRSVTPDGEDHWHGCTAGRWLMGIESDGAVKGCPSLQTRHYVGGNVRERSLRDVWDDAPELAITRARSADELWGFCKTCVFAETCMGGCTFTARSLLGRPGNNPYCHFRARTLAARGVRERLVACEAAPGEPFDNGRFELVEEPVDAPDLRPVEARALVKIRRAKSGASLG
jgi:radical SAM protein with 4Fe4S-binding SPASM domain